MAWVSVIVAWAPFVLMLKNATEIAELTLFLAVGIIGLSRPVLGADSAIRVRSVSIKGVQRVDESALRYALAARSSSKLPWGTKRYFDCAQFEADLRQYWNVQKWYALAGRLYAATSYGNKAEENG